MIAFPANNLYLFYIWTGVWVSFSSMSFLSLQFPSVILILTVKMFQWISIALETRNREAHSNVTPQQRSLPIRWGDFNSVLSLNLNPLPTCLRSKLIIFCQFIGYSGVQHVKWSVHWFSWWELWIGCLKR